MLKQINKLVRKLSHACKGQDLITMFVALETVMEDVIEQISDDRLRNLITIRLIQMTVFLPSLASIKIDASQQDLKTIAEITDNDIRYAVVLGKIKAIVDIATPLSLDGQTRESLSSLRRPYKDIKGADADAVICNLYELAATAARTIGQIPETKVQMLAILVYIQGVIAMADFNHVETSKLKEILRSVADIPDEDFREAASLQHIENILDAYPVDKDRG